MKEEKLFETMADINENYVADAHKNPNKKRAISWMRWVAVAACLCVVIVGAIAIPKTKAPVQTPDGVVSATTTLYNDSKYIALLTPEALKEVGWPDTISEDVIGVHVAYLELSGEITDYVETEKETDIELYTCTVETTKEVYILRDGDAYWPVAKIED